MNKSFELYQKKLKKENNDNESSGFFKRFLFSTLIKTLIVIVLFLGSLIYIRQNDDNKDNFKNVVYNNSLSFAKIYSLYNKYLGDVIPFKNAFKDNTKLVSSNKITYSNITKESNGYILDVSSDYALSSISSGIVVEKKKSDTYGNLIKVQDKEGLNVTYGMLSDINVDLYDYVEKGEIIGKANKKLYLIFEKDGKYLSYEKHL